MKKVFKQFIFGTFVVVASSIVAGYTAYKVSGGVVVLPQENTQTDSFITKAAMPIVPAGQNIDLTGAAEKSVHAVVHIKSTAAAMTYKNGTMVCYPPSWPL